MKRIGLILTFLFSVALTVSASAPSALAEGRWVRVTVDSLGLYQLTHSRLRDLGFPDPSKVRVFGYAASQLSAHDLASAPDDLPELPSVHAADKLLFYAEAGIHFTYEPPSDANRHWSVNRERNQASNSGCYFLSDAPAAGPSAVTEVTATKAGGASRTSHMSVSFMEDELEVPAGGGTFFVGHELTDGKTPDYRVRIVDPASDLISFQVAGAVRNLKSSQNNYLTLEFPDGDLTVGDNTDFTSALRVQSIFERFRPCRKVVMATVAEPKADATYRFRAIPPTPAKGADFNFAALDWVVVTYERLNNLVSTPTLDMVMFDVADGESVALTGTSPSTIVWNVTDPSRVESYPVAPDGTFTIPSAAGRLHLVAFNPEAAQREPQTAVTENQSLHTMACPDAVILTNSLFRPWAEQLAEYHAQFQGLDVAVVDQQEVFNEFSSGTPHIMAVRRFLRHLSQAAPGKLRGLVIYGAGTAYQASHLPGDGIFVITAENEDPGDGTTNSANSPDQYGYHDMTRSFATDTYFGRLEDFEPDARYSSPFFNVLTSPLSVVVGRIPVTSPAQADDYNDKARRYLEFPPMVAAPNNAMFVSGFALRTEDMHMADAERLASVAVGRHGSRITIHRSAHNLFGTSTSDDRAITSLISSTLRRGVGFMTYFGHGNSVGLTGVWSLNNVNNTNYTLAMPLAMLGSCDVAAYDIDLNSLSSAMVLKRTGGVIGLVASGREVYQNLNADFGEQFAHSYFGLPDGEMLGQAYLEAHNSQLAGRDKLRICNLLAYNYFGDPLLPHYGVSRDIDVTAVNGAGAIIPGGINTFEGTVKRADGTVDTDFNGTVKVAVYDHPYTAVNRAPVVSAGVRPSTITEIELDQEQLTELVGAVKSGRFTVQGHIPAAQREGSHCRVTLYAFSDDLSTRAGGALSDVTVDYDATPVSGDFAEPRILSFGIDGLDPSGNRPLNSNSARLTASISAPAGMVIGGNFCASVRLLRDGSLCSDAASGLVATAPGVYSLTFDVEIPADGRHELSLTVTDALQRQASASLEFSSANPLLCSLTADNTGSAIAFTVGSGSASSAERCTVTVEDFAGNAVRILDADSFGAVEWNLRDSDGRRVAPGHYRAFARLLSGNSHYWSRPVDLVVR